MRQYTVKPAWIGRALKRRPYWEGQTRLIPFVFNMFSFHAFLKWKTVKRTLLQMDNFFSPHLKKHPALREHISGISDKKRNWTFLSIFSKGNIFLHFKTTFFKFKFGVLKECNIFDSNALFFIPSCFLQPTNNCFCAIESNINLQTILHPSMNYWFQYCDLN